MTSPTIPTMREALAELVACHTESAGWSMSMLKDRAEFDQMLARSQERVEAAVNAARAALAADDAARGEMLEDFEAWWQDAGPCMNVTGAEALMIWQASRAAAPQADWRLAAAQFLRDEIAEKDAAGVAWGNRVNELEGAASKLEMLAMASPYGLDCAGPAAAPQSVEPVCFTSQSWLDQPIQSPKVVSATSRDGFDVPLYLAPPTAPTKKEQP